MRSLPAACCVALLGPLTAGPAPAQGRTEPRLEVAPKAPRPGDPVLITVTGVDHAPRGTAGKIPLLFFPVRQGWQAIVAMPIDHAGARPAPVGGPAGKAVPASRDPASPIEDPPVEMKIVLTDPALSHTLSATPRSWAEEQVKIDPEMAEPPADKRKIIDSDNVAIIAALKDRSPPRFGGSFAMPGSGSPTSAFGAWRVFNGGYRSRHLGLDLAARKGAAVRTIQDGEVTLVRSGFLTGGTVVVAHGAGIASAYFHLDDIKVAVGDAIKRGTVLGNVGMSGRTTGPHIHVGVWVPGGFIDPAAFLRLRFGAPVSPPPK